MRNQNSVTAEKRHYLWIQDRALVENDHAEMIARIARHGFNGVIVLPSSRVECFYPTEIFPQSERRVNGEHLFPHFARLARAAGLKVFAWLLVGQWNRWSHTTIAHPLEWNMSEAGYDRDWLNLARPDVRETVVSAASEMLAIANVAGVVLDYIRMPTGHADLHPHVTLAVRMIREMMEVEFRGRELLASVLSVAGGRPSATLNEQKAQRWPAWLKRNLVDGVLVMMHHGPDTLHAALADMPTSGVSIMSTPGGVSHFNPDPFTDDEFEMVLDIIETSRFGLPTLWHFEGMLPHHWDIYKKYAEAY